MRNKRSRIRPPHIQSAKLFGAILLFLVTALIVTLIGRSFYIAVFKDVDHHNLSREAQQTFIQKQIVAAQRGKIYTADDTVLAENSSTYNMYAVLDKRQKEGNKPLYVVDKEETAKQISKVLKVKESKILKFLKPKKKVFQVEFGKYGRNLSVVQYQKLKALKLPGINFTSQPARQYPDGNLASHIIGAVKAEEKQPGLTKITGIMGIESAENKLLAGVDGLKQAATTPGYQVSQGQKNKKVKNGDDVYLTLQSNLQNTLEQKLDVLDKELKPKNLVGVLMDAKTGAILAASQRPNYNPNTLKGIDKQWENLLNQGAFEPGSVIKAVTLAASINEGIWKPNEKFQTGTLTIGDQHINDFFKNIGMITYREGFARSSNVAFSLMEQKMGAEKWKSYLHKFGFLQSTHSDLPAEDPGSIAFNYPIEQANTAFGQGIGVTPLQLLQAYSAFANGGKMVKPYIVKKIVDPETHKTVYKAKTEYSKQIIKKSTANEVKKDMIDVVNMEVGTAKEFSLKDDGYQIAAKTGTAQIAKNGKYTNDLYHSIHSVMILAPEKDPQFIFFLAANSPTQFPEGSSQASMAKVFKPLMLQALSESKAAIKSKSNEVKVPNVVGLDYKKAIDKIKEEGFDPVIVGDKKGKIKSQVFSADQLALKGQKVFLKTKGNITVPDMRGWTLAEVKRFCEIVECDLKFSGEGYVVSQSLGKDNVINRKDTLVIQLKEKE